VLVVRSAHTSAVARHAVVVAELNGYSPLEDVRLQARPSTQPDQYRGAIASRARSPAVHHRTRAHAPPQLTRAPTHPWRQADLAEVDLDPDPTAMLEEALSAEMPFEAAEEEFEAEPVDATLGELNDPERPLISSFDIDPKTVAVLAAKGILNFTPIQAQTYNLLKGGQDMLGRSRTGTGKTLAFALPLIQAMADSNPTDGERLARGRKPRMIVLAPTRELARQVLDQPHDLPPLVTFVSFLV